MMVENGDEDGALRVSRLGPLAPWGPELASTPDDKGGSTENLAIPLFFTWQIMG